MLDAFESLTNIVDSNCKNLKPWQIVLYASTAGAAATYLYYYYNEIDTGILYLLDLENTLFSKQMNLIQDMVTFFKNKFFKIAKKIPMVASKIKIELDATQKTLEGEMLKANKGQDYLRDLPAKGLTNDELHEKLDMYLQLGDGKWKDGACSGAVYDVDDDIIELTTEVFKKFSCSNALHASNFTFKIKIIHFRR